MSDELGELPKQIDITWRKSELIRWLEDYGTDYWPDMHVFDSPARGTVDIYTDPFALVGILFEPVPTGWRGVPYVLAGATLAAVQMLRQWCAALETAAGKLPSRGKTKSSDGHMAYPIPESRAKIVQHFNRDRVYIDNIEAWAQYHYQISRKTLKRYRDEFEPPPDM